MREKRLVTLIMALLAAITMPLPVCFAEGDTALLQSYVREQYIDVFVAGSMNPDNLSVKVSNQAAAVTDSGSVTEKDITVRTTILLDISTSVPSAARGNVNAYINSLIEHISKNEQFKIVTFGEQLTMLQDFTSDRYDLANAADKIEFNGQQSKIYDAIYNTIPKVQPIDGEPCYYRTIVITDGIDDTASGITKEELYLKLQSDSYPIDVAAVSKVKQTEPEKELSALTRMSGGRYINIYPETDISGFSSSLAVSGVFWVRAEIPSSLLDGSTRQVNISDGSNSVQFDVKVSALDAPVAEAVETPESSAEDATVTPISTIPPIEGESESPKSIMTLFGDYTLVAFIGAGVALIIIIAVIIAITVIRGKKKKQSSQYDIDDGISASNESCYEKTEFIGDVNITGAQFTIKLSNPNNPGKNWILPANGELIIGRAEHCAIRLDGKSVSREQCKIVVQAQGLAVVNLSQTNKTFLNGVNVTGNSSLQSGDTLKFGREVLHIDYIQSLGVPVHTHEPEKVSSGSKTESIF